MNTRSLVYPKYAAAEFFSYRSILYIIAFLYDNFSNTVGYLCVSSCVQILGIIFAKKMPKYYKNKQKLCNFMYYSITYTQKFPNMP